MFNHVLLDHVWLVWPVMGVVVATIEQGGGRCDGMKER